jgi:glycosyltransferase involved in cell wall biosynthesis
VRITFVLPGRARRFSGGFKVLYRHARGLASRGHDVSLIHSPFDTLDAHWTAVLRRRAAYVAGVAGLLQWSPCAWISCDSHLRAAWVPRIEDEWLPDADVIIVSHWQSAMRARNLSPSKGIKFYLVQEYEFYMSADSALRGRIAAAFASGYHTLAISHAVADMLRQCGARPSALVPDGVELDTLVRTTPVAQRDAMTVGMPWRPEPFKGASVGLNALETARRLHPLKVWAFGSDSPTGLPGWVEFLYRPSDVQLCRRLNDTAVFVVPSAFEGFGLPGAEAMACGAALVSTDNGGVRTYAEPGIHALLSPAGDAVALSSNLSRLVSDTALRHRIAAAGYERIRGFSWERSTDALEAALVREMTGAPATGPASG